MDRFENTGYSSPTGQTQGAPRGTAAPRALSVSDTRTVRQWRLAERLADIQ